MDIVEIYFKSAMTGATERVYSSAPDYQPIADRALASGVWEALTTETWAVPDEDGTHRCTVQADDLGIGIYTVYACEEESEMAW